MTAITAYHKHGIHKNAVRMILNDIFLMPAQLGNICDDYTLLYWSPQYVKEQIEDGIIWRAGKAFQVQFIGCTPEQVYHHDKQIMLSFRVPAKEYNLMSVVLIKLGK